MGFRMGPSVLSPARDVEFAWYRDHLRELRHILSARDEGLLSDDEAYSRMLAVILRGLGESK